MFKLTVNKNEKALLYKDEKFIKLLDVGVYKMFHLIPRYKVEKIDIENNGIEGEMARMLYQLFPESVKRYFTVVELEYNERAYVNINGKFTDFMTTGETKLYWKELDISVERVNIHLDYLVLDKHYRYIELLESNISGVSKHTVSVNEVAYLYCNEEFVKTLPTGKYYFYTELNQIDILKIDRRIQVLEVNSQEILTSDKVTLRCNLTIHYQIADGIRYLTSVDEPKEYLYKQLQFAVRKHVGRLDIDSILSMQHTLSQKVQTELVAIFEQIGVELKTVHIKDIILPGEMREIFNQVIEASKRAEANNIKRREETAATRSLLNTAKLMRDNPTLARLKELEALEKITHSVGTLNVYGGLEHVMNGMISLKD
jgi:regulator of protease activity HflC (stomatin/prohibitin superfamily)